MQDDQKCGQLVEAAQRSVAEAYDLLYYLERVAQVQLYAMWTGQKLKVMPQPIIEQTMRTIGGPMYGGKPHWDHHFEALKRMLDRITSTDRERRKIFGRLANAIEGMWGPSQVRRLLEHEKFKAAAGLLHEREQLRAAQWQRPDERVAQIAGDEYEPELEVDLFSLLTAFQAVVERAKHRPRVVLPPEQLPVEVRIDQLLARLSETEACGFEDLFADVEERSGLIVTFLALLEMIRLKLVRVFQAGSFGPIRVYKRARPADAPHPIGDPETHHG